jgi:membrane-bound serine protease (ClpP class)
MVDKQVDLPDYKRAGAILTLNTDDAVRAGIADSTAATLDAALAQQHLSGAPQIVESFTWAERVARFATDPAVSGLLLTLGMLGAMRIYGIVGLIVGPLILSLPMRAQNQGLA